MRASIAFLLFAASIGAQAADLPKPEEVSRKAQAQLDRCIKEERCDVNACVSNGGRKNSYASTEVYWDQQIAKLDAALRTRDPWCRTYWNELKEKHDAFRDSAMEAKALADGPINTDDDLALLISKQRYELGYGILSNYACRPPEPAPRKAGKR